MKVLDVCLVIWILIPVHPNYLKCMCGKQEMCVYERERERGWEEGAQLQKY